jgi:hypothetical protein
MIRRCVARLRSPGRALRLPGVSRAGQGSWCWPGGWLLPPGGERYLVVHQLHDRAEVWSQLAALNSSPRGHDEARQPARQRPATTGSGRPSTLWSPRPSRSWSWSRPIAHRSCDQKSGTTSLAQAREEGACLPARSAGYPVRFWTAETEELVTPTSAEELKCRPSLPTSRTRSSTRS